jgi:hypothetical protein
MGQFQPGMSGNPEGRPKGSSGGRVQALAALDVMLAKRKNQRALVKALESEFLGNPVRFFKTIIMPLLPREAKLSLNQRLIVAVEQRRVCWPGGDGQLTTEYTEGTERGEGNSDRINRIDGMGEGSDWDVLTNEMKRYEYVISPSGGISYGAPSGYHDDCVIALALANHRRWESENVGRMLPVGGGRGSLAQRRGERKARVLVG